MHRDTANEISKIFNKCCHLDLGNIMMSSFFGDEQITSKDLVYLEA